MYDMIKSHLAGAVPFASTTGVSILDIAAGEATANLEQRPEVNNHIASMHAGALFTLGEAASGAAMSGAFVEQLLQVRPIATDASIEYVKIAKGTITAKAKTSEPGPDLVARLAADGKVRFQVDVTLSNESDQEVARMKVGWLVSAR
jgi:acyl-coenzyme A thioesterase PaaI-like protein